MVEGRDLDLAVRGLRSGITSWCSGVLVQFCAACGRFLTFRVLSWKRKVVRRHDSLRVTHRPAAWGKTTAPTASGLKRSALIFRHWTSFYVEKGSFI